MDLRELGAAPGKWLIGNCGKMPSERNCQLIMMAPESQREDLLGAAVAHAVRDHGHQDTPGLRAELDKLWETVTI